MNRPDAALQVLELYIKHGDDSATVSALKEVAAYINRLEEQTATQDQLAELPSAGYATVLDLLEAGIEEAEAQEQEFAEAGMTHFADAHRLDATYLRIVAGFLAYMDNSESETDEE